MKVETVTDEDTKKPPANPGGFISLSLSLSGGFMPDTHREAWDTPTWIGGGHHPLHYDPVR